MKELIRDSNVGSTKNRVIYMPIFKSLVDVWVLLFIHMKYGIEIPFTFGNDEEIPTPRIVEDISKLQGFVFMNYKK